MTAGELLALFRVQMRDEETPYLWDDPEVLAYINDAQNMFCRLTDGIADASTLSVTRAAFAQGDVSITLHPSILKIRTLARLSNGAPVTVLNVEDMPTRNMRFDGRTGPLAALVEGMEENTGFLWPIPNDTDTLVMTVFRMPIDPITEGTDTFEIAAQHHLHLLLWVKHHAYLKQDAQTIDKTKAAEFEAAFRAYCEAVKLEQQKKRHKVRTVAYGGVPHQGAQYGDYWYTRGTP